MSDKEVAKQVRQRLLDSVARLKAGGYLKARDRDEVYRTDDDLSIGVLHEDAVPLRDGVTSVRARSRRELNKDVP